MKILTVHDWNTLNYPEKKVGSAEIKIISYDSGFYHMEGVRGYKYCEVKKDIKIRVLQINGETVMLDDPLHWIGMEELARHSYGNVCVAGLGLGLVVHHLIKNDKVSDVDIFEINKDVIDLILPLLPKNDKINIINTDFFKESYRNKRYDVIILDLWVGEDGDFKICGTDKKVSMFAFYMKVKVNNPKSRVFIWGIRDSYMNPAVEVCSNG